MQLARDRLTGVDDLNLIVQMLDLWPQPAIMSASQNQGIHPLCQQRTYIICQELIGLRLLERACLDPLD